MLLVSVHHDRPMDAYGSRKVGTFTGEPRLRGMKIATPCHESWDAMTAAEGGRHCDSCDRTVVDLTSLTPDQARVTFNHDLPQRAQAGERICVRARTDARQRLLSPTQRMLTNAFAGMLAVVTAGALGHGPMLGAAESTPSPAPSADPIPKEGEPDHVIMGKIAMGDAYAPAPVPVEPDSITMGEMCVAPPPPVTEITIDGVATQVAAEKGQQLGFLLTEAEGRWQENMMVPMIAPRFTLKVAAGKGAAYQILMDSILTGPQGGVTDIDLVTRIIALIEKP